MPIINPEILKWARETADLNLAEAAELIDLKAAKGRTGAERLSALESGEEQPSRPLLLRMSQKYRRSLLIFYLSQPPRRGDRGQDFRNLPGEAAYDANLDVLIRDLKARQSLVKDLLEEEEVAPLPFIGSATMSDSYEAVAQDIVSTFGFSLEVFRAQSNKDEAFAYLRQRIEANGIFVLLIGDLGSHHTRISVETFRGFSIADPIAPFVVANDHDARAAWAFTVLHEVAHLWLGTTGVSSTSDELEIEKYCNNVAGEILLPSNELAEFRRIKSTSFEDALSQVSSFAEEKNLSRAMVAYKLFKSGQIEETRWRELTRRFNQDWLERSAVEEENKAKKKESGGGGGPNYYVVKRHRVGRALLGLVGRSISQGSVSPTKAGKILGVKAGNVAQLLSNSQQRGGM